jgi:SOS-response transcriptional repressor LexA
MPRPSRIDEAKVEIDRFYAEHGVMPTIEGFARAMGYRSTSSAHNTVMGLVKSGYLAQEERGGRLLPGPLFVRPNAKPGATTSQGIPAEIVNSLPTGVKLAVLEVPNESLVEHAIRVGDMLVVADPGRTDLSDLLLQSRGVALVISGQRKPGWRVLGVLVAQFRRYGRQG